MVVQIPDKKQVEELGLRFEGGVVKDEEGHIIPLSDMRLKQVRKRLNWNIVGPGIAILIFVLGWVGVVSERAYTATVNAETLIKQATVIEKQDAQIDELKKANERQEIMINKQTQILQKQDSIMNISREYHDKRSEAIERDVVGELRALRIDLKDMKSELTELKSLMRAAMHRKAKTPPKE